MSQKNKRNAELLKEIDTLRERIAELERANYNSKSTKLDYALEHYRRAELVSKSGNWEMHLNSKKILGSEGAVKIYGLQGSVFEYKVIVKATLPQYRKQVNAAINDLILHHIPYDIEFKIKSADQGIVKTIHSVGEYDEDKNIIFGTLQDISEYAKVRDEYIQSEEKKDMLIDLAPDAFFQGDYDGNIIRVNSKAVELTGYSQAELLTFHISKLFRPESLKKKPLRFDLLKQGETLITERDVLRKDGTIITVEMNSRMMPDQTYLSFFRDISTRKQIEKDLQQSESKYRILFEHSADAILIIQGEHFVDCNEAALAMLGYSQKQELINLHPAFISPETQPDNRKSFEKAKEMMTIAIQNESHRFEWIHKRKDGSLIPVEVLLTPIVSEEQNYIHVVLRDITEQKESQRKLLENENKMRLIVEGTPNLFFYTQDTEPKLIYISPSVETITGRSREEWFSRKDWFLTKNPSNEKVRALTWKHLGGEITKGPMYAEIEHADGHNIILEIYENPIFEDDKVVGLQGVAHDISQRITAENALKESEKNFRLLFENSPLGTYVATPNGTIVDGNNALLEILGSPSLEATKQINVLTFPPLVSVGYADYFKKCVKEKKTLFFELSYKTKWGKEIFMSSYVVPLINEMGNVEKVYTIMEDITKRKKAEAEKMQLETQLRRSQKMETIGTLAGGIAHDFNNILAPILGFTELAMLKIEASSPIANDLKQVLNGVKRAKGLVEQILLFSKQSEKERKPLRLQALINEALKLIRPSIPATVDIQLSLDETCPPVNADATQIHQVVVNLCTNAWQAMEESGGILRIELEQIILDDPVAKLNHNLVPGSYACLSIRDTGPGMTAEVVERIFEPFFTTKAVDKGTGLGLSVVHGIVHSHKGDIQVETESGKGTTFHIYLPLVHKEITEESREITEIQGGTESILIVDDEPAIAQMVQTMLTNFGYKADVFKTATDAIDSFKKNPDRYDMAISDLTMPHMTGLDLADHLHSIKPTLPVIIMTGFGDNLTKASQEHYGVKRVLSKPVSVIELATATRLILDENK